MLKWWSIRATPEEASPLRATAIARAAPAEDVYYRAVAFAGAYPVTALWGALPPALLLALRRRRDRRGGGGDDRDGAGGGDAAARGPPPVPALVPGGAPALVALALGATGLLAASASLDVMAVL